MDINLEELINQCYISYSPIIYEDFLPISAAGIFQFNLGDKGNQQFTAHNNQHLFERDLGYLVVDFFELYKKQQAASIQTCLAFFR